MILWNVNTSPSNIGTAFWKSSQNHQSAADIKFESIKKYSTFLFLKRSTADDNVLTIFTSPCDPWLRKSSGLARKTSHSSFGNQDFSSAFFVQYVRWDDHFQRSCLFTYKIRHEKTKIVPLYNNPLFYYSFCALRVVFVSAHRDCECLFLGWYVSIMGNKRQKIWQGGCTSPPLNEELMATSFLFRLSLFFFFFFFTSHFPCERLMASIRRIPCLTYRCALLKRPFLSSATLNNTEKKEKKNGSKSCCFFLYFNCWSWNITCFERSSRRDFILVSCANPRIPIFFPPTSTRSTIRI